MGNFKELLERKPLSLVVSLPENDIALARAAMEEGADALKVHYNVGHRASGNHFGPLDMYAEVFRAIRSEFGGLLGVVPSGSIDGAQREDVERLGGLGFDFYSIYAHHLPSFMLSDLGLDPTFAINEEYDASLVTSAGSLRLHRSGGIHCTWKRIWYTAKLRGCTQVSPSGLASPGTGIGSFPAKAGAGGCSGAARYRGKSDHAWGGRDRQHRGTATKGCERVPECGGQSEPSGLIN